jgi:6-phosphogluconolactonase/glucosamine-6-phosphate isomerase/deaminase
VFVVSAAGGGIYAASIAALFLARMQDECPTFAQHVFAISSVSGGSLGAGIFNSLAKQRAENGDWRPCNTTFSLSHPEVVERRL